MIVLSAFFLIFNFVFQSGDFNAQYIFRRAIEGGLMQYILIEDNYPEMSKKAVAIFISELEKVLDLKERAVIMLPTGGTYFNEGGFYSILRTEYKDSIDWNRVIFFNLDEYLDIAAEDEASYNHQLKVNILDPLGVKAGNRYLFEGCSRDVSVEIARREELIEELGGIDISLLGIGINGHIGFNEPGSAFDSRTRVVELSDETRAQNRGYFEDRVMPESAITVGISTILSSKVIILLASGESKSDAVKDMLNNVDSSLNPASFLNRADRSTVFYIFDTDAISGFELSEIEHMITREE
jgi:glucosamine-6-phosphate deaminase